MAAVDGVSPHGAASAALWRLPHTLTLLPTYKCTAACANCCFQSNPYITKRVPQERLRYHIEQAAELGTVRLVVFSGGEAFLLREDLVELVALCADRGMLTRIVTNGYWATSPKAAARRLRPLVEAGLNEINFSTGDDHAAFVPLERIICGIESAVSVGLPTALMIESGARRGVTAKTVVPQLAARPRIAEAMDMRMLTVIESPWMAFGGDANPVAQPNQMLVNRSNLAERSPCRSVLSTMVVTPDERLGMCCGLPREEIPDLHAGDLRQEPMRDLVERALHDFLKIWLFVEGPERILAWAAQRDPTIEWENLYAHNCDACRAMYSDSRVMALVREQYEDRFDAVMHKYALYCAGQPPVASV